MHWAHRASPTAQKLIEAEDLVFEASARYGMEYTILRPTLVCGRTAKFAESVVSALMRLLASNGALEGSSAMVQLTAVIIAAMSACRAGSRQ